MSPSSAHSPRINECQAFTKQGTPCQMQGWYRYGGIQLCMGHLKQRGFYEAWLAERRRLSDASR